MLLRERLAWGLVIFLVFGYCSDSSAQSDSQQLEPAVASSGAAHINSRDAINRRKLEEEVTFDYEEIPFIDIMDELRATHGLNVILDTSARDDSLTEDELVTIKVRGIKMSFALQLMLEDFNATYIVRDEVIRIISKDVAGDPEFHVRRIINCRELLEKLRKSKKADPDAVTSVETVSGAAKKQLRAQRGGGGVFRLVPGNEIQGLVDENGQVDKEEQGKTWFLVKRGQFLPENELINTIKTCVAPDDWDDTNGDGSVQCIGGCIVVTQTETAIKQIEILLSELSTTMGDE